MRKSDYAFWMFLVLSLAAAGTTVMNLTRNHAAIAASNGNSDIYRQLDLFGDVLERVRSQYVEKPDDKKLIESAVNGMLTALDPHSAYLDAKSFRDMQVQTKGEFGGLGIEVTMEKGVVKVVAPIDGTPAQRAGIQSGDLITHLDNQEIIGLNLEEAVEKMRGPVNSPIVLTIVRKGVEEPFDVKVVRDIIRIKPVKSRVEGKIGYIKISAFHQRTNQTLKEEVAKLKKQIGPGLKGFIIDLRNNPGGLLDQAIAVSDSFLERGAVVLTRGRNAEETERANAKPGDITDRAKLVVLVNGGSASASEIVAGALQDHKRATIIGTRTFGKGSVQTIIPLGNNNGAIRLTTARYYTPSGRSIQALGIKPDIVVEQPLPEEMKNKKIRTRGEASLRGHLKGEAEKEEAGSSSYVPRDRSKDAQLNYAIKFLNGTLTAKANPKKAAAETKAN